MEDTRLRSKKFAIRIIRFARELPNDETARIITRQIVRSGTSVGANWRAAHRAKSNADMANKLKIVEEECDETSYWLELLQEAGYEHPEIKSLRQEADELTRIAVSSIRTLRGTTKLK